MSIEITIIVTIISASLALAGLIITGQNGLRREMREQRKEMQEQGEKHSNEITEVKNDLTEVKNDLTEVKLAVAALKATVETYFRVRVDPTHAGQPWQRAPRTTGAD